ncbi:hypothetical protein AWH48_12095 [Domibacillus aminovorans]|uniref:Uncharacterized protein n=1 Tax=Domibacillus aminovorans TaxID=29332 RepID=A0A177KKI3_9BACI|nr:hypothetical protein [Domibacillus aminovorans]OAH53091.1 hypothetical protein AWH48_12095 [Domibacillus aminovorans]
MKNMFKKARKAVLATAIAGAAIAGLGSVGSTEASAASWVNLGTDYVNPQESGPSPWENGAVRYSTGSSYKWGGAPSFFVYSKIGIGDAKLTQELWEYDAGGTDDLITSKSFYPTQAAYNTVPTYQVTNSDGDDTDGTLEYYVKYRYNFTSDTFSPKFYDYR